jgi:hypothetical protein
MFTGHGGRERRRVDLSGRQTDPGIRRKQIRIGLLNPNPVNRNDILEKARLMRTEREQNRQREKASVVIQVIVSFSDCFPALHTMSLQAAYRSHRVRRSTKQALRADFDSCAFAQDLTNVNTIRQMLSKFFFFYNPTADVDRLRKMSETLVASMRQKGDGRGSVMFI